MKTVLVVDDEPLIRQLIETVLLDEGYTVLIANSGSRMLQTLETARPDAILLDVMMPNGDGREAFKIMQTHAQFRHIPVVMMSAGVGAHALDPAITAFIPKPFDIDMLIETVARVVAVNEV